MRYAVIGDVHSNYEALAAVLGAAQDQGVESFLFLGDLVGYNADPDGCADMLSARPVAAAVRGNHDKAAAGRMNLQWFNSWARMAIEWTRAHASARTLECVAGLPQGPLVVEEGILLCHGSPMDEDCYVLDGTSVRDSFRFLEDEYPGVRICFFGHTHVAIMLGGSGRLETRDGETALEPDRRYLINPGSVGQPRDGNWRASFGILDTGKRTYRNLRIAYDVATVQRKILAAGLPTPLAQRLERGA